MKAVVELTKKDERYPKLLSQIHDAPKILYCRGNLDLLESDCFAVVGTRKLTSYGKEAANNIVGGLVGAGFTIVSGLAMGIDTVAHQAALDNDGKTIAVLGSGLNEKVIYPKTNIHLTENILEKSGLLISEYQPDFKATEWTFPRRNRIISGLSKGVLVIEADKESGALITAKCALDQNRDVFAVPGSILSPRSVGPNTLIQSGAKLVMDAYDIISEYRENLDLQSNKVKKSFRNSTEEKIFDLLNQNGVMFIDDIIRGSSIESSSVSVSLTMLELRGLVRNLGNGKYRIS